MAIQKQDAELIITIVTAILKFGTPIVKELINRLEKDTITLEDLQDMRISLEPIQYFPTYKEKLENGEIK